jgi:hypothetical protein
MKGPRAGGKQALAARSRAACTTKVANAAPAIDLDLLAWQRGTWMPKHVSRTKAMSYQYLADERVFIF